MEITQAQKYEILEHELLNGAGLEEILKKCLEILMKSERKIHNENYLDYSNGYRYRKIYGSGKLLELQVPRTRNGNFYPMILALLKDQQEEAQRVAYSLYRKGLTTQDVAEVFEELYGKNYSTSQVSRMFDYARKEKQISLAVKQTPKRAFSTSFHLSEIELQHQIHDLHNQLD